MKKERTCIYNGPSNYNAESETLGYVQHPTIYWCEPFRSSCFAAPVAHELLILLIPEQPILTEVGSCAMLSSVIALQKPARSATGGIPAGIPFFTKEVFLYAEAVHYLRSADLTAEKQACGVEFTNMYGDINEAFYYSIESMFADFVRVLNNLDSEAYYNRNADRIKEMCLSTNCVGWGFPEEMMNIYYEIRWLEEEE